MDGLVDILKTNTFKLTSSKESETEQNLLPQRKNNQNLFFMSMAQTKSSGYPRNVSSYEAVLTLDGNKFNTKYRGSAVNYFGDERKRIGFTTSQDEAEDRIYSNDNKIKNAASYIKNIDFMFPVDMEDSNPLLYEPLKKIVDLSKKYNIPLRGYTRDTVRYLPMSKAYMSIDEIEEKLEALKNKSTEKSSGYFDRKEQKRATNFPKEMKEKLDSFLWILENNKTKLSQAPDKAKQYIDDVIRDDSSMHPIIDGIFYALKMNIRPDATLYNESSDIVKALNNNRVKPNIESFIEFVKRKYG